MRQPDLIDPDPQEGLFDEDRPPILYRADPDKVRAELLTILAQARAASVVPWRHDMQRYYQTVFPQMSRWLPEAEAAQLCFEFETELKRLLAA